MNIRSKKGFTLIELVMIIVILGILAAVAVPRYLDLSTQATQSTVKGILGSLRSANAIITANYAVGGTAATWNMTNIAGSANLQGVPTAVANATELDFTVNNQAYTATMAAPPSVGGPQAIIYSTW